MCIRDRFYFLRGQGLLGRGGAVPPVGPVPTATATPESGAAVSPTPSAEPGASPVAAEATPGPESTPTLPAGVPGPATGRTAVPTRTPKPKPTATATPVPTPAPTQPPTPTPTPFARPDATYITRRFVKINTSPSQARVFLNGRYIGISDDWDDAGGGALLTFPSDGRQRLRLTYPGRKDAIVDVLVAPNAVEDRVEVDRSLEKGSPAGPSGPAGKISRPDYQTTGLVRLEVEPPFATVTVDGHDMGPASRYLAQDMQFKEQGVWDVILTAPGYQPRAVRVLVSLSTGKERAIIREKLRKP